jgi:hypothetical protein
MLVLFKRWRTFQVTNTSVGDPDPHPDPDRRIRMFLGLPDQHTDPLVTGTDPAPDLSIIKLK